MKKQLRFTFLLASGLAVALMQGASARTISTFDLGGADAEVREAAPTKPVRVDANERLCVRRECAGRAAHLTRPSLCPAAPRRHRPARRLVDTPRSHPNLCQLTVA